MLSALTFSKGTTTSKPDLKNKSGVDVPWVKGTGPSSQLFGWNYEKDARKPCILL